MKATTKIILRPRKKPTDELQRVDIRVTYDRQPRTYATGHYLSEEDFDKVMGKAPRGRFKEIQLELKTLENRVLDIIDELGEDFSFDKFKERYYSRRQSSRTVWGLFEEHIAQLEAEQRTKSASKYRSSQKKLHSFAPKVKWRELTPEFLRRFEAHLIKHEHISISTVNFYLSALRAMCNLAVEKQLMSMGQYPFGRRKYQIPEASNVKKALTFDEAKKIIQYEPETTVERYYRDLWVLSYLCNGANIKDIALLKWSDLDGKLLTFRRSKTARSTTQLVRVPLIDLALEIIQQWGNHDSKPNGRIFKIIREGADGKRESLDADKEVRKVNVYVDKIAKNVGIEKHVTTYTARHTYATVMKRNGASIEMISESLGHRDLRTTEHYLDSFEDEAKLVFQEKLV